MDIIERGNQLERAIKNIFQALGGTGMAQPALIMKLMSDNAVSESSARRAIQDMVEAGTLLEDTTKRPYNLSLRPTGGGGGGYFANL